MWGWQVGQILGQACLLITEQEPPAKAESVVWHCSWGDMNAYLLTPDREPVTDQQSSLCQPQHFIGVTYQSRNDWESAASPKAHASMCDITPAWVTSRQPGRHHTSQGDISWEQESGVHCTAVGSSTGQSVSVPGSSASLIPFQVSGLVCAASRLSCLNLF